MARMFQTLILLAALVATSCTSGSATPDAAATATTTTTATELSVETDPSADAVETTTATTATTSDAPDDDPEISDYAEGSFGLPGTLRLVECVQTGWGQLRTTVDWQPNAGAEPIDLNVGVIFPAGGDQALGGGQTTLRLAEPGEISWDYTLEVFGSTTADFFVGERDPFGAASCVVLAPDQDPDAAWIIEDIGIDPPEPVGDGNTSDLGEFLASIDFAEDDSLLPVSYLEDQGGFVLFDEFALVEGLRLETVSASMLDGCTVVSSTYGGDAEAVVTQFSGCDDLREDSVSPGGTWSVQLDGLDQGDLRWFDV